jgi:hypothetical protein
VIVEVVPDKVAAVQSTLDRVGSASAKEMSRYTDAQLALIGDFLTRMEQITRDEATTLRENPSGDVSGDSGPSASEHTAPLGGLTNARLNIRSGLSSLRLLGGAETAQLYRAAFDGATPQVRLRDGRVLIQYRGIPFDWRKRTASIRLNESIPWSIEVVGGVQSVQADVRAIDVRKFDLVGGTERIQLELGTPHGDVPVRIVGGARTIRIERPRDVGVRVKVQGQTASLVLDGTTLGKRGGESTMVSPTWSKTRDRYDVEIVGGSRTIEVVGRP